MIGENRNELSSWYQRGGKRLILGGAAVAALFGAFQMGSCYTERDDLERVISERQQYSLEEYKALTGAVEKNLQQYPEYANKFIVMSIDVVRSSDVDFTPQSYARMFSVIKDYAESRPEIMDSFGPRAKSYLNPGKRVLRKIEEEGSEIIEYGKEKLDQVKNKINGWME